MSRNRNSSTSPLARWRAACVDGVLHTAYAAAVRAESTARRCARRPARRRNPLAGARPRRASRLHR